MLKKPKLISAAVLVLSITSGFFLLWVIYNLDPTEPGLNVAIFYAVSFVFCLSVSFLLGFWFRKVAGKREFVANHILVSARQALWFSLLAVGSLLLSSFGIFNWVNSIILAGMFIFLEAYFLYQR